MKNDSGPGPIDDQSENPGELLGKTEAQLKDVRALFLEKLMRIVAGAIKATRDAHGNPDAGSVAKRVAAQLWGETKPKAHPDPAAFMRHARGQLGLSQVAFAAALGAKQDQVSRWELGRNVPRQHWIDRTSQLLQEQIARQ